jgi:DNA adenine methylase
MIVFMDNQNYKDATFKLKQRHQQTVNQDIRRTSSILEYPKPFVKWVGGKRAIIKNLLEKLPNKINNYYEPFVGGGALFFKIYNSVNGKCYLSDLNINLILSYITIQNQPEELIKQLEIHQYKHNKDYYYDIRNMQSISDPILNSARFIYLLKTCFNGLYRVNKNNQFNTPIGNYKNPNICDTKNIMLVSKALTNVNIKYQDFTKIQPKKGDFVYFDPPYHPITKQSFVQYVSNGFTDQDQVCLKNFALKLSQDGVNVMISNSNSDFINEIYKTDFNIHKIKAPRVVNCKADKRSPVFETLITNY